MIYRRPEQRNKEIEAYQKCGKRSKSSTGSPSPTAGRTKKVTSSQAIQSSQRLNFVDAGHVRVWCGQLLMATKAMGANSFKLRMNICLVIFLQAMTAHNVDVVLILLMLSYLFGINCLQYLSFVFFL